MEEARAKSHQSVDWYAYFKSIREQCPWSYAAYVKGLIHIVEYQGVKLPLGSYQARIYIVRSIDSVVESLAQALDYEDTECEWLYSYPGYGPFATPVSVIIQQNRSELARLRQQIGE